MQELEIRLDRMHFFAFHGVYDFEREKGNNFEVSLAVKYPLKDNKELLEDNLENTVSYVDLWDIVRSEMAIPRNLIETVAACILDKTKHNFPFVTHIECSVTKLNPPIEDFQGSASVRLTYRK